MFSKYLIEQGVLFGYETEGIPLKRGDGAVIHYIPDFVIEGQPKKYVAIAATYSRSDNMKILLFSQQYPGEHLEVWSPETFREYGLIERFGK